MDCDSIYIGSALDSYLFAPKKVKVFYHFHFDEKQYFSFANRFGFCFSRKPDKTIFLAKSIEEKVAAFDKYLEAAFSLEIIRNNYELKGLDYNQFCRTEVSTLYTDDCISHEFIDTLIEKYGIDRDFLAGNEQLLARISNNEQIIRI